MYEEVSSDLGSHDGAPVNTGRTIKFQKQGDEYVQRLFEELVFKLFNTKINLHYTDSVCGSQRSQCASIRKTNQ